MVLFFLEYVYGLLTGGILMCFEADALLGHTALKRRLLEASGWTIIPLSYQEVKHALDPYRLASSLQSEYEPISAAFK